MIKERNWYVSYLGEVYEVRYWTFGRHMIADNDAKGQNFGSETVSGDHTAERCGSICFQNRLGCKNFELCPIEGSIEDQEACLQYEKKLTANTLTHEDPEEDNPKCTGYYKLGNISNYIACRGSPRK